ncbi:hypothetical protein AB3S75_023670 [Citrus x aurantiifolia]
MGYYIPYQLDEKVYKHPTKAHIGLNECQSLISMKELGANHTHLYIAMLHAHMANDIAGRPFGFIHTGLVSSAHDKDAFAQGKCEYTQSELDEVRLEYAFFVSELIV